MDSAAVLSVMTATAINSAMPGPCMILIASRAAMSGQLSGLRASLGIAAAQLAYVLVALALLALAWNISETTHTAIRFTGAAILVVLAVQMLADARSSAAGTSLPSPRPGSDLFVGLCVGLSSPFNLIFMFAILPQVVSPEAVHGPDLVILVAGIFAATMGPMMVTTWLAAGTRNIGLAFVPRLMRAGAFAMLLFAGISIASVA